MYGAFNSWMVEGLGGLSTLSTVTPSSSSPAEATTGWRQIVVHPDPFAVAKLKKGGLRMKTRFGTAAVQWSYQDGKAITNVTIPVGSVGSVVHDVRLGQCTLETVREGRHLLWSASPKDEPVVDAGNGILVAAKRAGAGRIETAVGSGSYAFAREYSC